MYYKLTDREQAAMERIIAQVAQNHGQAEEAVRKDITELIVESMKTSRFRPGGARAVEGVPLRGGRPHPGGVPALDQLPRKGQLDGMGNRRAGTPPRAWLLFYNEKHK